VSRLDKVALAKQSAMGTKTTVMEYVVPVESSDPKLNRTEMTREETDGTKFPTDLEYGARFWEVPLSGAARLNSLPRLLSGFMGAPTTILAPGGVSTSKKHQFDPWGKTLVPHSMEVDRLDPKPNPIADRFWDCIGNDLTLSIAPNDWIAFDASYVAKERDAAITPTAVAVDLSRRFAFHAFTAFISVNGAAEVALPLEAFSVTYSNNVSSDQVQLGSRSLFKVQEGNVGATIAFTPKSTLDAHYARATLDGDPDNCKIRLIATGAVIDGTAVQTLELIAYRAQYTDAPAPVAAGSTLDGLAVAARCAGDFTLSKFLDVNVINAVAAY
jgi:hypothetical protein